MASSNIEARDELQSLMDERGFSYSLVARRLNKDPNWVRRRVRGQTRMDIDEYNLIRSAIDPRLAA